jgi:hypothetical protein
MAFVCEHRARLPDVFQRKRQQSVGFSVWQSVSDDRARDGHRLAPVLGIQAV